MPSTRSKAGGGGCGCGAAVAVLRAGVVGEVVKTVRKAWANIDDEAVEVDNPRKFHNKEWARRLLGLLVDGMDVAQTSEADVSEKTPSLFLNDTRDHHAERHCRYREGHVHVLLRRSQRALPVSSGLCCLQPWTSPSSSSAATLYFSKLSLFRRASLAVPYSPSKETRGK